jgi:hypothetical protein
MEIDSLEALVHNRKMKVRTMYEEIKLYNTYAILGEDLPFCCTLQDED